MKREKLFDAKARKHCEKDHKITGPYRRGRTMQLFFNLDKLQDECDQLIEYVSQSLGIKGKVAKAVNPVKSEISGDLEFRVLSLRSNDTFLKPNLTCPTQQRQGVFVAINPIGILIGRLMNSSRPT